MVEAGDLVRIKTAKEEIEGVLLESYEAGIYLIKLKSGYNIGIAKEDVFDIETVKKRNIEKSGETVFKAKKGIPNIDMIATGGTISSRLDSETGGVKWLTSPNELFRFYPGLFNLANVRNLERPFSVFSENMTCKEWSEIAKIAAKSLNDKDVKGVIITHGTDFLHYTSAALSFFLQNLNKPVVLTYSQRSTDRASSDAELNLVCATQAAISDIAEVMLVGHGSMSDDYCLAMPGTKVRKMHTSRRDTFKVINDRAFAKVWADKIEKIRDFNKRDDNKKVKLDAVFDDKVALVKFYPGQDPEILDYYGQRYNGIVVEASGLGHMPTGMETKHNWLPKIKKAIDNGLTICAAPQTIYGRLNPYVYSAGRELLKAGVIYLEDMLPETGFVKLGWVLAHKEWNDKIRASMLKNFVGEINNRLEE